MPKVTKNTPKTDWKDPEKKYARVLASIGGSSKGDYVEIYKVATIKNGRELTKGKIISGTKNGLEIVCNVGDLEFVSEDSVPAVLKVK